MLSGAVRILTHPRVTGGVFETAEVLDRANELHGARGVSPVRPGPSHWSIFSDLCERLDARGNIVPDCYHAAIAIEHDATWASPDSFFERIDELSWVRPWPGRQ